MLHFDSFIQTEQIFSIDHGPSITLNHISVDATLIIDENYHNHIRRILKKSLPPNIQIQLLYAPNHVQNKFSIFFSKKKKFPFFLDCHETTIINK